MFKKLINALLVIISIVCLSQFAAAQADSAKPLSAKALAALVAELKGIVARTEPDKKKSARVAGKWDARKDLTGKTKSQVINLLYEDVKSVITDSGTQYQISSIFSTYKQMPDASFSGQKQNLTATQLKSDAAAQLLDLTFRAHPYVGVEEQLATLPKAEEMAAIDRKNQTETFDTALNENKKLTPEQKSFVKANYEKLGEIVDKKITDRTNADFPTEQWIKESLQQSYTAKFTVGELNKLIAFFQETAGQQVLTYVRISNMAELIIGNGGTLDYTKEDKTEHDKFAATALGKKFLTAFLTESETYSKRKETAARAKNKDSEDFSILEPANLNKLFNRFVLENYKK
ncbi:MAG: hypothetical protein ACR2HG_13220 [Pyrinomonadaceae bacterium]